MGGGDGRAGRVVDVQERVGAAPLDAQWEHKGSVNELMGSGENVYKKQLARRHTCTTSLTGKSHSCAVGIETTSQDSCARVGAGLRTSPLAGSAPEGRAVLGVCVCVSAVEEAGCLK